MKLLKKYQVLILTIIAFLSSSFRCAMDFEADYYPVIYSIKNNTTDTLIIKECPFDLDVKEAFEIKWPFDTIYPGETKGGFNLGFLDVSKDEIVPEDVLNNFNNDWEHYIMIFRKQTLDSHSKEELIENNIYDAKYILTTKEIQDMGRVVNYPIDND